MPSSNADLTNKQMYELLCQQINSSKQLLQTELKSLSDNLNKKLNTLEDTVEKLEDENCLLKKKIEYLHNKNRKNNVVIVGLEIRGDLLENTIQQISDLVDVEITAKDVNNIYRIGRNEEQLKKPILLEFVTQIKKQEVLRNANKLKGKKIFINHEYSQENLKIQKILRKGLKEAREQNYKAYIKHNKLIVNDEEVTYEDLINPESGQEKSTSQDVQKSSKIEEQVKSQKLIESAVPFVTKLRNRNKN